jgi:hypothetical protein
MLFVSTAVAGSNILALLQVPAGLFHWATFTFARAAPTKS